MESSRADGKCSLFFFFKSQNKKYSLMFSVCSPFSHPSVSECHLLWGINEKSAFLMYLCQDQFVPQRDVLKKWMFEGEC